VELPPPINLGPGDATPNPFKIQDKRKREGLHHELVARIAESKREASGNGLTSKVQRTPVPRFPSSPRVSGGLTPAAQRLLHNIGNSTPRRSGFEIATPARTPAPRFKTVMKKP
jgi:protein DGCR14